MKRGFTLIELLVVIAIIAVLAAILFPIYTSAKEQGKQTRCLNNLKQLSAAVPQYCADYAGVMPICLGYFPSPEIPDWAGCLHDGTTPKCVITRGGLWKYTRNADIYKCPSDQGVIASGSGAGSGAATFPISYSMNDSIGSSPGCPSNDSHMLSKSNLDRETAGRSSKVLLFIHEARDRINDGFFAWGNEWDIPGDVHNSGTTVSYVDGHCKWGSKKQLLKEMYSSQWLSNTKVH